MKKHAKIIFAVMFVVLILVAAGITCAVSNENPFIGSFWSLVPPVVAIVLALITKEVYSSLLLGIAVGALLYANFRPVSALDALMQEGLIASVSGTAGIFVFLVILGIMVCLVNRAGGAAAFGRWAETHIKSRAGAMLCTFALGVIIFIDDYFNCLTVGSVMRPVTDGHKISRAKLAYLIDATAAPVCMIAPISSWAAAVSEYTSDVVDAAGNPVSSLALFCRAIPYNFYSLLTFVFIIGIVAMKFDFGSMKKHEALAAAGDVYGGVKPDAQASEDEIAHSENGRVIDLVLPVLVLILCSVIALVYVGGFFDTASEYYMDFIGSFGNTDATVGLPLGGFVALIFTIIYMALRKLINIKVSTDCIPKGFNAMVPAILILVFATALKNMTGLLGSDDFVKAALSGADTLQKFLPAIIFLVACGISFATGTSWGTFGILIPIVLGVFPAGSELMIIGMSACLAGAVCGDHCSPISDTTIMSSAGAVCDHVAHVSTQIPYAVTVAAVSFVGYVIAGFLPYWYIVLPLSALIMLGTLAVIKKVSAKNG